MKPYLFILRLSLMVVLMASPPIIIASKADVLRGSSKGRYKQTSPLPRLKDMTDYKRSTLVPSAVLPPSSTPHVAPRPSSSRPSLPLPPYPPAMLSLSCLVTIQWYHVPQPTSPEYPLFPVPVISPETSVLVTAPSETTSPPRPPTDTITLPRPPTDIITGPIENLPPPQNENLPTLQPSNPPSSPMSLPSPSPAPNALTNNASLPYNNTEPPAQLCSELTNLLNSPPYLTVPSLNFQAQTPSTAASTATCTISSTPTLLSNASAAKQLADFTSSLNTTSPWNLPNRAAVSSQSQLQGHLLGCSDFILVVACGRPVLSLRSTPGCRSEASGSSTNGPAPAPEPPNAEILPPGETETLMPSAPQTPLFAGTPFPITSSSPKVPAPSSNPPRLPTAPSSNPPRLPTAPSSNPPRLPTAPSSNPPRLPTAPSSNPPRLPTAPSSNPLRLPTAPSSNPPRLPTAPSSNPLRLPTAPSSNPLRLPTAPSSNPLRLPTAPSSNPPRLPTAPSSNSPVPLQPIPSYPRPPSSTSQLPTFTQIPSPPTPPSGPSLPTPLSPPTPFRNADNTFPPFSPFIHLLPSLPPPLPHPPLYPKSPPLPVSPLTVLHPKPSSTVVISSPLPTTAATSSAALSATNIQGILDVHNQYRALHGAPPLTWSSALANVAEQWASNCVFMHSPYLYGENLVISTGLEPPAQAALWYTEEACLYNYSEPGFSESTGHFTQMVWASTTMIGCYAAGAATCPNGITNPMPAHFFNTQVYTMLVCEYDVPGNTGGSASYSANVSPPLVPDSSCSSIG
ncbi:hypothetical protein CEUSTIGMA_g1802.t1 [Chlamydomonas eustigma]|uniref:SCP domain-containing protein n=1 Tax=Chlamydomonas eustigma TaxID=1157962 RepID=A0A250WU52_9CHLO|nr:hypothetical protein CEUSTIGMA_g1802.t1 [Chlamydomonas eustigma]|eukprot:GAX74353.1 hypothetical protein CEUSTIGMA_g1802.t1 [Chlamydomonas eustigma]